MKPPPVSHHGPETLDEAVGLLAEHGGHAKVLAGGQSLVPLLNMRLTAPAHLVDINRLGSLALRRVDAGGRARRRPGQAHHAGARPGARTPPSRSCARP